MPALLQMAKGKETNSGYGNELTEIFHGFGEDEDEEIARILEAKLSRCPSSEQRSLALKVVEQARQIAEQFVKDFGGLDGV